MYTWGTAGMALGHGEHTGRVQPTRIAAMLSKRVVDVAVGQDKRNPFLLLLTATGDIYSCGSNRSGNIFFKVLLLLCYCIVLV